MSDQMYQFRKDDGEVVEVDFLTMLQQQHGYLQLADGSWARRVHDDQPEQAPPAELAHHPIISDSLGFPEQQLGLMRKHLEQTGLRGIEFIRDPTCQNFIQVKCGTEREKLAYAKSRQFHDHNSSNGSAAMFSPEHLEQARELVSR